MADQVKMPESGGGEGNPVVATVPIPAPEIKPEAPVELAKINAPDVKPLETKEIISEEPKETKTEGLKEAQPETPKEVKPEEPKEVKPEQPALEQPESAKYVKVEEPKDVQEVVAVPDKVVDATPNESNPAASEIKVEANGIAENNSSPKQDDSEHREAELLQKIEDIEKVKNERTKETLLLELKVREEEIDLLKARVKNLETELQAALSKPSGKNHEMIENIKQQHEELLSKARGMIFDKTKMVKNQELQIEALTTQIQSLKDINQITKDLLEIRNSEIKAMEDRLQAMEARFKAEKERYGLVLQRAQTSSNINDDLRKEYETQLVLFKELREKYDQRVQALVAENERLKGTVKQPNGAGTSG